MNIRPGRYFEHLNGRIFELLPVTDVPAEFSVEFLVKEQTIQFNMLTDKDIELLVEGVKSSIKNIHDMVLTSIRPQYEEPVYFPFGRHMDRMRASVIIRIRYREDGSFEGPRINHNIGRC